MLCSEMMKSDVECVSPQTSVQDAARRMRDQNIGFLPVCDESGRPVGTITDRDIAVRVVADNHPAATPVETFITYEVIACYTDDDVAYARDLMAENQKSRIMCVDRNGCIEGIISLSDLVDFDEIDGARTLQRVSGRESREDARPAPQPGL